MDWISGLRVEWLPVYDRVDGSVVKIQYCAVWDKCRWVGALIETDDEDGSDWEASLIVGGEGKASETFRTEKSARAWCVGKLKDLVEAD